MMAQINIACYMLLPRLSPSLGLNLSDGMIADPLT